MSRYRPGSAYSHRIRRIGEDHYRLSWIVDYFNKGSRLRFPRPFARDTDEAGARRFAKRWKLSLPVENAAVSPSHGES